MIWSAIMWVRSRLLEILTWNWEFLSIHDGLVLRRCSRANTLCKCKISKSISVLFDLSYSHVFKPFRVLNAIKRGGPSNECRTSATEKKRHSLNHKQDRNVALYQCLFPAELVFTDLYFYSPLIDKQRWRCTQIPNVRLLNTQLTNFIFLHTVHLFTGKYLFI